MKFNEFCISRNLLYPESCRSKKFIMISYYWLTLLGKMNGKAQKEFLQFYRIVLFALRKEIRQKRNLFNTERSFGPERFRLVHRFHCTTFNKILINRNGSPTNSDFI